MSVILKSGNSSDLASINAAGELSVAMPANPATAGYVKVTGSLGNPLAIASSGYMLTGSDTMLFSDQVDGAAVNTNQWLTANTTLVTAQAAGFIQLNSTSLTTAAGAAQLTSIKQFTLNGGHSLIVEFTATVNVGAQANATMEMGIGVASGTSTPTDGVFFRYSTNGDLLGVMNYGGVEVTTAPLPVPTLNEAHEYVVLIDNDSAVFVIDRTSITVLARPAAQPFPTSVTRMPIFARVYNGGSAPATAPKLHIGQVLVTQTLVNMGRDWVTGLTSLGRGAQQAPLTPFAQTGNNANSATPASASLANTTAGYATLGGRYQFAAPAGAATDYALFAYQVPAGFQFFVKNAQVTTVNTGAAVATTATILEWMIGANSSAISLATADGVGTWAPRRIALGVQGFVIGDAIGKTAQPVQMPFDAPLVVDSGRYLHIIVQVPVGTATASQVIRGTVAVNGYFE